MSGAPLGKLIRLLSSDQPGEVAAAAGAINRALKSRGIDIHKLAEVVEHQFRENAARSPTTQHRSGRAHPAKRWHRQTSRARSIPACRSRWATPSSVTSRTDYSAHAGVARPGSR